MLESRRGSPTGGRKDGRVATSRAPSDRGPSATPAAISETTHTMSDTEAGAGPEGSLILRHESLYVRKTGAEVHWITVHRVGGPDGELSVSEGTRVPLSVDADGAPIDDPGADDVLHYETHTITSICVDGVLELFHVKQLWCDGAAVRETSWKETGGDC